MWACERAGGPESWRRGARQERGPRGLMVPNPWSGFCSKRDGKSFRGFGEEVSLMCIFRKNPWTAVWTVAFREVREAG